MTYTPPDNDAVNFALRTYTPTVVNGVNSTLAGYSAPENDAVDFSLAIYSPRTANGINFDLSGIAYYGILKRWAGAIWVKEPMKTWLAGSWQTKSLKRWSGADWLLIDTTGA